MYKEECIYSFETPVSSFSCMIVVLIWGTDNNAFLIINFNDCIYQQEGDGGLYVSLHSFFGVGRQWLELHHRKTNDRLYLHIVRREIPKVIVHCTCINYRIARITITNNNCMCRYFNPLVT